MSLNSFLERAIVVTRPVIQELACQPETFTFLLERCYALDILLAVEQQAQQRAEEVLNALSRDRLGDIAFELLRSEIRETLRKRFGETGAEHDNELRRQGLVQGSTCRKRDFSRRDAATTRIKA